jgi:hypothetical protein
MRLDTSKLNLHFSSGSIYGYCWLLLWKAQDYIAYSYLCDCFFNSFSPALSISIFNCLGFKEGYKNEHGGLMSEITTRRIINAISELISKHRSDSET